MGLRSEPGRGSQFWFVVPLEPNPKLPMPPMAEGRPLRVLLADDLAPARHAITELLQVCGALVDAVSSARDAREVLQREARSGCAYDAFIFDHSVLAADDGSLLLAIKHPTFGTVRRILLASSLRYPEVPSEEPGDFDAVVVKPILTHEALNQALRGQRTTHPAANSELHRMPVSRYRALVAEDNVINQIVLGRMLAALGCSAEYADTGAQAVTLVTERHYDIVFMDIRLPELDGIEATRQIRARRPDGSPPIIAVTANNSPDDRSDCLAAGMNDYLQKPVRIGELLATIDRWIAVRPA
ncbi:hypothetical protein DB354_16135 [Opitutus sp. ER46]|nr:hypothetical protein DB354_16135 [Opitutus sp. ER46]